VTGPGSTSLLEFVPGEAGSTLRVLEIGTDPQAGASAVELANRSGGPVVSLSRSSRMIATARLARATDRRLTFRRQLPLEAGWPPGGP